MKEDRELKELQGKKKKNQIKGQWRKEGKGWRRKRENIKIGRKIKKSTTGKTDNEGKSKHDAGKKRRWKQYHN